MTGDWGEQWLAGEIARLRHARGLSKASFADSINIHRRTVSRYERGATAATNHRIIEALDNLLCQTVREAAPGLTPIQVRQMHRREALKLLVAGAAPAGAGAALSAPSNGRPRRVGDSGLTHLRAVTTGLAQLYPTVPSGVLLQPAAAHMEDTARLLRRSMLPDQRQRLQIVIADAAMLVGYLACNEHRPGQADATFRLAERHARETGDNALLVTALTAQSFLRSSVEGGGRSPSPEALALLEEASELAARHGPALTRAATYAWLAQERAASKDPSGAEEALERAESALEAAIAEDLPLSGATADYYFLPSDDRLARFRAVCDLALERPQHAVETLTETLARVDGPRRRVVILADLGGALAGQDQPEEACGRLVEGYRLSVEDYPMGLERIVGVRAGFPPAFAALACTHDLDDLLRHGV